MSDAWLILRHEDWHRVTTEVAPRHGDNVRLVALDELGELRARPGAAFGKLGAHRIATEASTRRPSGDLAGNVPFEGQDFALKVH